MSNIISTVGHVTAIDAIIANDDGSYQVPGYIWQKIYAAGEFWRIAAVDDTDSYFDEKDTLAEAIEFVLGSASDAELDAM